MIAIGEKNIPYVVRNISAQAIYTSSCGGKNYGIDGPAWYALAKV